MELNTFQLISFEIFLAGIGFFLVIKCFSLTKDNMNYFRRSVFVLEAFLILNIPIRLFELHIVQLNKICITWMYDISIILMTYLMFNWFLFILKQLESKLVNSIKKVHLCLIPALITIPLCIINHWTGWLFYIGEDGWYHRGSIFIFQSLISYLYFICIFIINIVHFFTNKNKSVVRKCFFSTLPAFISGFLQFAFGGSFLCAGAVVCALIMYVSICLERIKVYEINEQLSEINSELALSNKTIARNMKTILALSEIYHIIYDIDVLNDTFIEIKAPDQVAKFCQQFSSAKQCLRALPDAMFEKKDVPVIKELYNPDTLIERCKNNNTFSADGFGKITKRWLRSIFIVSERDEQGNPLHIIVSLQDITQEKEQQKIAEEAAFYEKSAKEMEELFHQTAEALASAIDAKDKYTHGHSVRVAEYSKKIAELAGFSEERCKEVFYAGLLHDVGKIGVPDEIINKETKLTNEEFAQIKKHPVMGREILKSISKLPYLSVGALHHHERYDGNGYPDKLKATDIPELARIIAVADAYDAMTSKRSYRDPIPQQKVREEFVKGLGTQFDPNFGKLMLYLIDLDTEYNMKEKEETTELSIKSDLVCKEEGKDYSEGIVIDAHKVIIKVHCNKNTDVDSYPFIVLFDSLDGRIHTVPREIEDLHYSEYCQLFFNGEAKEEDIRKIRIEKNQLKLNHQEKEEYDFFIEAVKIKDHISIKMTLDYLQLNTTIALKDSTRYGYIALTGKNCTLSNITIDREEGLYPAEKIQRIAEEISFIDMPDGDIPSVQIDGWRSAHTKGLKIEKNLKLNFHMKSLPFARLVWHCPHIVIYTSDDGELNGKNFREFALIRYDGELWQSDKAVVNKFFATKTEEFRSWDFWKEENKKGRDTQIIVSKDDDVITLLTGCGGIEIKNTMTLLENIPDLYISITGDQCVIENIKIS